MRHFQGAQEVFRELPIEYVSVDNLAKVAKGGGASVWLTCRLNLNRSTFPFFVATNKLYGCVVDMPDNLVRKSDGGFDVNEYFSHPELYASNFARKVC